MPRGASCVRETLVGVLGLKRTRQATHHLAFPANRAISSNPLLSLSRMSAPPRTDIARAGDQALLGRILATRGKEHTQ
jgi:hypothetical protein